MALLNGFPQANISSGGGIDYSTTEQDTGLFWIDGKKIYQKTITVTVPSITKEQYEADSVQNIDVQLSTVGITNVDLVIDCAGFVYNDNAGAFRPINSTIEHSNTYSPKDEELTVIPKRTVLTVMNNTQGLSGKTAYITLRYTKTT